MSRNSDPNKKTPPARRFFAEFGGIIDNAMVILSAAKEMAGTCAAAEILRCAQDDG